MIENKPVLIYNVTDSSPEAEGAVSVGLLGHDQDSALKFVEHVQNPCLPQYFKGRCHAQSEPFDIFDRRSHAFCPCIALGQLGQDMPCPVLARHEYVRAPRDLRMKPTIFQDRGL